MVNPRRRAIARAATFGSEFDAQGILKIPAVGRNRQTVSTRRQSKP